MTLVQVQVPGEGPTQGLPPGVLDATGTSPSPGLVLWASCCKDSQEKLCSATIHFLSRPFCHQLPSCLLSTDWDECADGLEHDCSPAAQCINLEGSYTCRCLTVRDANPSRAGRACAGESPCPPPCPPSSGPCPLWGPGGGAGPTAPSGRKGTVPRAHRPVRNPRKRF